MAGDQPRKIESFKDLEVWRVARSLTHDVYRATERFPQREWYGLSSQMRRAAVSAASNIAEGFSRSTLADYIHFLVMARSSAVELEAQLIIAEDLGYLDKEMSQEVYRQITSVQKMLWRLEERLRGRAKVVSMPQPP